jgi:hypothetical protein
VLIAKPDIVIRSHPTGPYSVQCPSLGTRPLRCDRLPDLKVAAVAYAKEVFAIRAIVVHKIVNGAAVV